MEGWYYLQGLFLSLEENRFAVWRGTECSLHEMLISLCLFIDSLERIGRQGTYHMIHMELPARVLFSCPVSSLCD
jgi:hypothetical protein